MDDQSGALAVLIGVASIVLGYVVFCIVPRVHFPRTGGILAANASIAALAFAGVGSAMHLLGWSVFASVFAIVVSISSDLEDREKAMRRPLDD